MIAKNSEILYRLFFVFFCPYVSGSNILYLNTLIECFILHSYIIYKAPAKPLRSISKPNSKFEFQGRIIGLMGTPDHKSSLLEMNDPVVAVKTIQSCPS